MFAVVLGGLSNSHAVGGSSACQDNRHFLQTDREHNEVTRLQNLQDSSCASSYSICIVGKQKDRLCGLVVKSSWLQIRRPGFDSRHYHKKKVVGLERGPLSLVSTIEDLLDRKVAAPV
jgi:hypothetical protein